MSRVLSSVNTGGTNIDFQFIYETFCTRVYGKALKITQDVHLAEDITQETFMKAYNKLDTIVEVEKVGAWLTTTASRTAIDFIRKEKGVGLMPMEDLERRLSDENKFTVEKKVEENFLDSELELMIDQLKPSLKEVFFMKYKKGLNESEIARQLHLPNGTVKSRLYRARKQLRTEVDLLFQVS